MHTIRIVIAGLVLALAIGQSAVHAVKPDDGRLTHEKGRLIFERSCAWCHGSEGRGDGPAAFYLGRYSSPRPRDFVQENFKFRSTASGDLPTDQDLFRTVTQGIPGYMPSFASLSEEQRWQVIAYVKSFNPAFKEEKPVPLPIPFPPYPSSEASVQRGREIYTKYGCQSCHGPNGRGDGPVSEAGNLQDSRGLRVQATDLTEPTSFKGGATPGDLYRTIMTGLDGTPMPSYGDQLSEGDHNGWDLVYYILSLSSSSKR
mgnify:CR=1 FL=1